MLVTLLLVCAGVCVSQETRYWNPLDPVLAYMKNETAKAQNFTVEQTTKMRNFIEYQKRHVETAINEGYEEAGRLKDRVENYVEEQQSKIRDDINGYVERVKDKGRETIEQMSYINTDEKDQAIENIDVTLSVPAIIARNGYPCETHTVISQGYVLNIHRIPHAKSKIGTSSKTVLLQHGVFASSADWVLNGPEKGLAYVLADAGYDVWMANIRGNRYSKEHIKYGKETKAFWNFSWHDVAMYDEPAIIDYIMATKGIHTKITYVGHSMGTTILFAMLTLRPEYNSVLQAGFALAPVVYMSHLRSPLKSLAPIASNMVYMEMLHGSHEFLPKESALGRLSSSCEAENMDSFVCKNVIFYLCGSNESQFNVTLLPAVLAHLGTGTSWKTVVHFAQEIMTGKFQKFDYGFYNNMILYGTPEPPEYDLSKITLPIKLFWSENDLFSAEKDVKALHQKLQNTTEMYLIPHHKFNHLDYLYAIDTPNLLNNKLLELIDDSYKTNNLFLFNFSL